jgi:formamidopyrimidine-DNA glycosylase
MPELPEVETVRRDLEKEVVGRRILGVSVTGLRSVRRHADTADFVARLTGAAVTGVSRRGKYLLLTLGTGDVLVVHLRMSGQLLMARATEPPARHTHVVLSFARGHQLRFVDPRTFGEMFLTSSAALGEGIRGITDLGFDPLDDDASLTSLRRAVEGRRRPIKTLLMDQHVVAGIGNIYSDEILFAAGLRGDRPANSLTTPEVRRLHRAVLEVLHEAVDHRGSSLLDEQYRDLYGEVGRYQSRHRVYGREGERCVRCPGIITRRKLGGRSTYSCPRCQV